MPELPDVTVYVEAVARRVAGSPLERLRLRSPFVMRTADPAISAVEGRTVLGVRRLGKRLVFDLEGELFLVVHLMIAGRLRWRERGAAPPAKVGLAALDFPNGTLILTEASTKKRASIHVVRGAPSLAQFERGGVEPLDADQATFRDAIQRDSHTLKRALTDPTLVSGIGNAYSDEILHRAKLSPVKLTRKLKSPEIERLYHATQSTLREWIGRLREETGDGFPENVTAFRKGMAVHGRYGKPCPVCGAKVQRIVYADNECNYCPRCQTEGRLLADRALSRLLRSDWPKSVDELEERHLLSPAVDIRRAPASVQKL